MAMPAVDAGINVSFIWWGNKGMEGGVLDRHEVPKLRFLMGSDHLFGVNCIHDTSKTIQNVQL